jgi:putative holliday junction resolvase
MAIIVIDLGTKKTGMAISYTPYIVSLDLPIIFESRQKELIGKILDVIKIHNKDNEKVERIVIGVPLNMNGEDTPKSIEIKEIGERLKRALGEDNKIQIVYTDESLSSKRAGEYINSKQKKNGMAKLDDSIAAKIILQEYINNL